jgi:hypothetical protein
MDQYELGVAMALTHLAELRGHAEQRCLGRRLPGRTADRHGDRAPGSPWVLGRHGQATARAAGPAVREAAILVQHHHQPGVFDAGHCQACARQAGLLEHYRRVQQEEAALRQAHRWALGASRRASVALWSSAAALLLAVVALVRG